MKETTEETQNTNNADVPQAVEHKITSNDFSVLLEKVVSNPGIFVIHFYYVEIFPGMMKQYEKSKSPVDFCKLLNIYLKNYDDLQAAVRKEDYSEKLPLEDDLLSYVSGKGFLDLCIILSLYNIFI